MKRAILIVDHGSRSSEANAQLSEVAASVRARVPECAVEIAHLELAQPDLAAAIDACVSRGVEEVLVLPFFLGPGRHTAIDIPRRLAETTRAHPKLRVRVGNVLGPHEKLIDILLERTRELW